MLDSGADMYDKYDDEEHIMIGPDTGMMHDKYESFHTHEVPPTPPLKQPTWVIPIASAPPPIPPFIQQPSYNPDLEQQGIPGASAPPEIPHQPADNPIAQPSMLKTLRILFSTKRNHQEETRDLIKTQYVAPKCQ